MCDSKSAEDNAVQMSPRMQDVQPVQQCPRDFRDKAQALRELYRQDTNEADKRIAQLLFDNEPGIIRTQYDDTVDRYGRDQLSSCSGTATALSYYFFAQDVATSTPSYAQKMDQGVQLLTKESGALEPLLAGSQEGYYYFMLTGECSHHFTIIVHRDGDDPRYDLYESDENPGVPLNFLPAYQEQAKHAPARTALIPSITSVAASIAPGASAAQGTAMSDDASTVHVVPSANQVSDDKGGGGSMGLDIPDDSASSGSVAVARSGLTASSTSLTVGELAARLAIIKERCKKQLTAKYIFVGAPI